LPDDIRFRQRNFEALLHQLGLANAMSKAHARYRATFAMTPNKWADRRLSQAPPSLSAPQLIQFRDRCFTATPVSPSLQRERVRIDNSRF
jgi:hypothetical protein